MNLRLGAEPVPLTTDPDGVIRVGQTRITLETVVAGFREGMSAESIREQYPTLRLADVYSVIAYYLSHQSEVDEYLHERERQAAATRQENEKEFPAAGARARLQSRKRPR